MTCINTPRDKFGTRQILSKRIVSICNNAKLARQRCILVLELVRRTLAMGGCYHSSTIIRGLVSCSAEEAVRKIWHADIPNHPFPTSPHQPRPSPHHPRPPPRLSNTHEKVEDHAACALRGIVGLIRERIDAEFDPQSKKKMALEYLKLYHPDKVGAHGFGAIPQELFEEVTKVLTMYLQ